jgi:hypothetical protein
MPLMKCQNNHMYNGDKHGKTCPICGLTQNKEQEEGKTQEELEAMLMLSEEDYVCAWLVCVEGINKGRAYPLHKGKNFVGSGNDMDVQVLGDSAVNLWRHTIIAYDAKKNETILLPGESVGIVYLEDAAVYTPKTIEAYARIEIGNSKFMFVPFCGDSHKW